MNNKYISIIVLVVVVAGAWFLIGHSKRAEAPEMNSGKMPPMQATGIPADYNAAISVAINAPVKEFTVTGQNFSFSPAVINVKKGDVVKITFKNGDGFHDFRIDEFKVSTHQIKTGEEETVTFIADKTGIFQYYCSVGKHRAMGMWGTLTVE